jgi:hypothetical protein
MSGLPIVVTSAGRAALVNAANTGTLPVTIAKIGVTAAAFTANPDGSDLVLPGELKQLSTFGGAAVADDTIHVTLRDDGSDVYSMRGFGLYLADGTLFALYGQAGVILEKSAQAMLVLSADIRFVNVDATSITFGDANFINPPATTEVQGVIEIATDAESVAGVDPGRAVAPRGLKAALDGRLGAGAPAAFVKGLLTLATAVAFRAALAIKSAALKDEGPGNGLDADLLDGQHGAFYRDYGSLQNVPPTFVPSTHPHSAADIDSGILGVLRGGTGVATFAAGSYLVGNDTGAIVVKTPVQVLANIGAAAVVHSHEIAAVNGLDNALAARPLQASVTAQISAAVNGLINGSPGALDTLNELAAAMGNDANFAATVTNALAQKAAIGHNHDATYLKLNPGYLSNDANVVPAQQMVGIGQMADPTTNTPTGSWTTIINVCDNNYGFQLAHPFFSEDVYTRSRQGGVFSAWRKLVFTDNPSFTGTATFTGALSCLTFNATSSDVHLKDDVKLFAPRPLHRLLAELPDSYGAVVSYTHRVDHAHRVGVIAQDMERVEPAYMGTIDIEEGQVEGIAAGRYKTVDKSSAAYEQAMWAGQEIDRLLARIEALEAR